MCKLLRSETNCRFIDNRSAIGSSAHNIWITSFDSPAILLFTHRMHLTHVIRGQLFHMAWLEMLASAKHRISVINSNNTNTRTHVATNTITRKYLIINQIDEFINMCRKRLWLNGRRRRYRYLGIYTYTTHTHTHAVAAHSQRISKYLCSLRLMPLTHFATTLCIFDRKQN